MSYIPRGMSTGGMEQDSSHHTWSAKVPVRALRPQLPQPDSPGTPRQQPPLFWELHGAHTCLCPQSYTVHVPVPGLLCGHSSPAVPTAQLDFPDSRNLL